MHKFQVAFNYCSAGHSALSTGVRAWVMKHETKLWLALHQKPRSRHRRGNGFVHGQKWREKERPQICPCLPRAVLWFIEKMKQKPGCYCLGKNKDIFKYFSLWLSDHWSNEPPACGISPMIALWKKTGWNQVPSRERLVSQKEISYNSGSFSDHLAWEIGTETMLVGRTAPQPGLLSHACMPLAFYLNLNVISGPWRWIWGVWF